MKVWNVGGKIYLDIDDAAEAVVGLVDDRMLKIYKTNRDDWEAMIRKEVRADLKYMQEGVHHNFMGVLITTGY